MKFSDEGIIIDARKYGENSLIVKIFSRQHGIYSGFVKFARSSKSAAIYQIGNMVSFEFFSRLEENLGSFAAIDLVESFCSKIIFERTKLECSNSLFYLLNEFFLERENHQDLFEKLHSFLQKVTAEKTSDWDVIAYYVKLELDILESLGYGVDLSCCVVTNSRVNLAFVSPKSARAVSFEAGKPYENKLLKLPNFLLENEATYDKHHLLDGLKLSGFFLEKFLLEDKKFNNFSHRKNILKALE